jgi:hypothetical protein
MCLVRDNVQRLQTQPKHDNALPASTLHIKAVCTASGFVCGTEPQVKGDEKEDNAAGVSHTIQCRTQTSAQNMVLSGRALSTQVLECDEEERTHPPL